VDGNRDLRSVNDTAAEIERIVRQVLAELRAAEVGPERQRAEADSGATQSDEVQKQGCVITERVVTLATLDGRLNGASVLTVPRGAVITPAVRDELKSRSIRLEFANASNNGNAKGVVDLLVGIADVPDDVGVVTKIIQDHVTGIAAVQSIQQTDLRTLMSRMAHWLDSRPSLAVVLTRRPAAAACLANRHRGLRAVWANTPKALTQAMSTIAPNVVTYNPAEHSASVQRTMLREFVSGGTRDCPEEFHV
jgi:hypothetical protein